jgi:hypothetical protein
MHLPVRAVGTIIDETKKPPKTADYGTAPDSQEMQSAADAAAGLSDRATKNGIQAGL